MRQLLRSGVSAAFLGVLLAGLASCGGEPTMPPQPPPPPPQPPVQVGSIPAQVVNVGESAMIDVAPYFLDPDGGPLTYAAATSAPGVVSVAVSGSSLTLVGVAEGTATVTVTATDPGGLSAAQGIAVTVETPNRPPVPLGSIPAQTVEAGRTLALDVASYFSDPDGDALTYGATTSAGGVLSVSVSGSTLTLVGVAQGTATVNVTATDPGGLSASQGLGVTVTRPNRAPTASAAIPAQSIETGQAERIDVSPYFSDPDGDPLEYATTSRNTVIVTAAVAGDTLTLTGVAQGAATVTVTATDPGGLSVTQSVRVTVRRANRAPTPVGSIPAQHIDAGRTARVDVAQYFSDPEGDALTYAAEASNGGVVSTSMFHSTLTMIGVAGGTTTVTVTATDPRGLTGTQAIEVSVTGRTGGFREDFDTPESLNDWDIQDADAVVSEADSLLELTNSVTGRLGAAELRSPPRLRAWELSAEISRETGDATPGVVWFTTHGRFLAVRLLLPMSSTVNYEFAVFDGAQNSWLTVDDLSGHTRSISAAPRSYDAIRLAHETQGRGFFVFEVGAPGGGNQIFRVGLDATLAGVRLGDILDGVVDLWLVNRADIGFTALFDWVEISGEEISADAAGGVGPSSGVSRGVDADRVRALAGAPAANRVRLGRSPVRPD